MLWFEKEHPPTLRYKLLQKHLHDIQKADLKNTYEIKAKNVFCNKFAYFIWYIFA